MSMTEIVDSSRALLAKKAADAKKTDKSKESKKIEETAEQSKEEEVEAAPPPDSPNAPDVPPLPPPPAGVFAHLANDKVFLQSMQVGTLLVVVIAAVTVLWIGGKFCCFGIILQAKPGPGGDAYNTGDGGTSVPWWRNQKLRQQLNEKNSKLKNLVSMSDTAYPKKGSWGLVLSKG